MGMLDGLLGQITSSLSGAAGQQTGLAGSLLQSLSQSGGLQGLIQNMEQNGLGQVASSWVGNGANLPITAAQIQQVLGNTQLQQLAAQHGLNVQDVATHLSQILPATVDKLTPNGSLPTGTANVAEGLGGMLKGLMGGQG